MNKYIKFYSGVNRQVIILMIFIALISVVDVVNMYGKLNFADVTYTVLFGINNINRVSIPLISRWSIPYIFIIYYIGKYIENIVLVESSYVWVLRYKSYSTWLKNICMNIFFNTFIYLSIFFTSTCFFSLILTGNTNNLSCDYLNLYNNIPYENISFIYIVIQFLLSYTSLFILILVQIFISFKYDNIILGESFCIFCVVFFGIIAKFDIYNPFMLTKHSIMNDRLSYNPVITILINISFILIIMYFISKAIHLLRRE